MTPYGWDNNVIQLLVAAALRANLVQIRYQEQDYLDYTDENLRNIVPNSRKFKKCEIKDLKDIDQETLHHAKEAIDDIWDQRVSQTLPKVIGALDERREEMYSQLKETERAADHIDLPIKEELKEIRRTLDDTLDEKQSTDLIKAIVDNKEEVSEANETLEKYYRFSEDSDKYSAFKNMLKFADDVLPQIKEELEDNNELDQLVRSKDIVDHWDTAVEDFSKATEVFSKVYSRQHIAVSEEYKEKIEDLKQKSSFQELDDDQQEDVLSDLQVHICDGEIGNPKENFKCPDCRRNLKDLEHDLALSDNRYNGAVQQAIDESREEEGEEEGQNEIESINLVQHTRRIDNQEQLDEFIMDIREELKQKLENGKSIEIR